MWYYDPVDDGWEEVPGIEPGLPLIECGRSTIELWNLYIIWVC